MHSPIFYFRHESIIEAYKSILYSKLINFDFGNKRYEKKRKFDEIDDLDDDTNNINFKKRKINELN